MAKVAIAAAAIALLGITILRHELWRDELQAWQIARASHGFSDLIHNTRYEGHPLLWFALLYPLAHAHPGPGAMQLLQFFIASATICIAVWRAPFTMLQRVLMVFGYFVLYEYGVLSRSYGLGTMFLVIACAIAATPGRRRWPVIGAVLGVLALTSAFGAVVAVSVLAGLLVDERVRRRSEAGPEAGTEAEADATAGSATSAASTAAMLAGSALVVVGLLIAYLQAGRPPADTGSYNHWRTHIDIGLAASSVSAVWRAIVPIPALHHAYWNTNIVTARASIVGVLGLAVFLVIAWLFRDRPGAFVVWVGGVVLVVGFLYARIGTATASRHIGHIFLCLFAAMWLAPSCSRSRPLSPRPFRSRARSSRRGATPEPPGSTLTRSIKPQSVSQGVGRSRLRSRAWTVLLVIQVVAGIFAVSLDLVYPFSNGRDVAQYIRREHLDKLEIVGLPDTAASTVAGYLDRPIYYLAGSRFGTFIVWNTARTHVAPLESVVGDITGSGPHVLVLLNQPLNDPNLHLELLTHFDNGIVGDEHFWLYLGTAKPIP